MLQRDSLQRVTCKFLNVECDPGARFRAAYMRGPALSAQRQSPRQIA
jgi:hypothetical protein